MRVFSERNNEIIKPLTNKLFDCQKYDVLTMYYQPYTLFSLIF